MATTIPTSLGDIRAAITKGRRMSFNYLREKIVADFYLLGQARKTGAYVIIAWCIEPGEWRLLRYALIKELETVGAIDIFRPDFNPRHPQIATVDTLAFMPARKQNN
ncbi:WYL domain-containing protein [Luteolibacter soli]|uniref:WYL domain-containing protein n=1 Tax=Luteolibacter soli TaxID=3135280 RepID=A0ABU9B2S2_9BACT